MYADYDELLADDSIDAVVIATPVPTHYALAKRALEAGKHALVEKPPAMRASEMEELVALAHERQRVLMPGHLLLYHPGVQKLKELIDAGDLGEVLCVYGNRQNLGKIRRDENALWSLGVHDLSVVLYLLDEEPSEVIAHGRDFLTEGVEDVVFCYLRFPSGRIAHMHLSWLDPHKMRRITVVGREKMVVFDDMELDQKVTIYDKAPESAPTSYGEWLTRSGDVFSPKIPPRRAAEARVPGVPRAGATATATADASPATGSRSCARSSACRRHSMADVHPTRDRLPGHGARRGREGARGRGRREAADALAALDREARGPAAGAARRRGRSSRPARSCSPGRRIGARVIVGDQACIRERVTIGDDVVVGRGSLVENDTTIGDLTKIQADAYITAYSTLEDNVFIAPCVVTTNDNFMGRTERRHDLIKGPTIRRGARVGGGAILCPGVEIGEEAFVGAGAVVTKDVPARKIVVGNPARVLRDVPDDELLSASS